MVEKYEELNKLRMTVEGLKKDYKLVKQRFDSGLISEEEKKAKNQLLLEKEFEYQEIKNKMNNAVPKRGDWIVAKSRYGFRRIRVAYDDLCGWG